MGATIVGLLILGVCMGFMVLSFRRARIRRNDFARVRRGPLYGESGSTRVPGSAMEIRDGGQVPSQELLGALGVPGASELNADDEEDGASGLGLTLHPGGSSTNQLPQVMEGTREGHQVFIRQGLVGDSISPGLRLRRSRAITVVRVFAPPFEGAFKGGRIEVGEDAPMAVSRFLAMLSDSPDVWHDGRLVAGSDGMAISRAAADDWLGGWIYDLWLLERLALELGADALPPVALSRDWEAPYGLHDWAPGLLDRPAA